MAIKVIKVGEDILGANEEKARMNKRLLEKNGIFTINIMSSPGAGKTSLILSTINRLKDQIKMAVIEGDVASSVDAEKVSQLGIPVVQINTAGGCHLDANMVQSALNSLPLEDTDLLFIENVGNLICPNAFVLGEDRRVMISSLPEGDDKPYKYPAMFADSDVVLVMPPAVAGVAAAVEALVTLRDVGAAARVHLVLNRRFDGGLGTRDFVAGVEQLWGSCPHVAADVPPVLDLPGLLDRGELPDLVLESSPLARAVSALGQAAAGLPEETLRRMEDAFLTSSRYELLFWEMAWRQEGWPA